MAFPLIVAASIVLAFLRHDDNDPFGGVRVC